MLEHVGVRERIHFFVFCCLVFFFCVVEVCLNWLNRIIALNGNTVRSQLPSLTLHTTDKNSLEKEITQKKPQNISAKDRTKDRAKSLTQYNIEKNQSLESLSSAWELLKNIRECTHNLKHKNKIAKGYPKKSCQEKTTEYTFCRGECKTEFMEAIKSRRILKDYLKQKNPKH